MVATTDFRKGSLKDISKEDLNTVLKNVQDGLKQRRTAKDLIEYSSPIRRLSIVMVGKARKHRMPCVNSKI